jgi:hypothetical protein
MLVLNLACPHDHRFEGWFGSAADFESQLERNLIACPICADTSINRLPSAPHLNVSHLREVRHELPRAQTAAAETTDAVTKLPDGGSLQAQVWAAIQQVIANTEDVGTRFAEEARRIHYGEAEERGIRGQASLAEKEELADEGIAVLSLPSPESLKGTLQ